MKVLVTFIGAIRLAITLCVSVLARAESPAPELLYQTNRFQGWTVLVDVRLIREQSDSTSKALELLRGHLQEIVRVVPEPALSRLREVTLWFSPPYPGVAPRAEYHPDAGWLRANRRNPAMARGIEYTDINNFETETRRMPNFTLHELAHAYHDRVLPGGFANLDIKSAYENAQAGGQYEQVERKDAEGRVRLDRAYALTDPMEYFAETTEAYFSRNDFFPFHRQELRRIDPGMEILLGRLWGTTRKTDP
ncbi:MAG TPA: hypothetical protein PLX89_01555 [Verrucomicrobiota bacterium]|nr:hypothetical protein [Verrucomicrobiota bacterium]